MKNFRILFIAMTAIFISFSVSAQNSRIQTGIQPNFHSNFIVKCQDLVVERLAVIDQTATSIKYKYSIKNIGTAKANLDGPTRANHDNVAVQAFLSKDASYDKTDLPAGGTILGVSPLGFLEPGHSKVGQFQSTIAGNTYDYNYLILIVDWKKSVNECKETNNFKVIKLQKPCPDLVFTRVILTNKTENSVAYKYTVKNIGTARVQLNNVAVQAYLSGNSTLESFDIPAGGRVLSTNSGEVLRPGQSMTQTFQSNTRENPFQYQMLLLKVDSNNNVRECNEDNNLGSTRL
jgi:hypothetical protein